MLLGLPSCSQSSSIWSIGSALTVGLILQLASSVHANELCCLYEPLSDLCGPPPLSRRTLGLILRFCSISMSSLYVNWSNPNWTTDPYSLPRQFLDYKDPFSELSKMFCLRMALSIFLTSPSNLTLGLIGGLSSRSTTVSQFVFLKNG